LQQRVTAHDVIRNLLHESASGTHNVTVIDLTNVFSNEHRELSRQYSDDGCHLNSRGAAMLQATIKSIIGTCSR
jgi:hypothetical protein